MTDWTPPVVYDVAYDKHRVVTQEDVDRWQKITEAYLALRKSLRAAAEADNALANSTLNLWTGYRWGADPSGHEPAHRVDNRLAVDDYDAIKERMKRIKESENS